MVLLCRVLFCFSRRFSVAFSTRVVSKWPVLSVHRRGPSSLLPWKTQCASGDRPFQLEWFQHRSKSAVCSSMEYRRIDLILGLPIRSCAGLRAVSGKRGFAYRSIVVRRSGPCLKLSPTVRLVAVHGVSGVCLLAGSCPTRLFGGKKTIVSVRGKQFLLFPSFAQASCWRCSS